MNNQRNKQTNKSITNGGRLEVKSNSMQSTIFFFTSLTEKAVNKTTLELLFSDYDKDVRPNQEGILFSS